jgi:hypothetical protein
MPGAGKSKLPKMEKYNNADRSLFLPSDIPNKVTLRGWHYQNALVAAIQKGFANGCDYTRALALFNAGLRLSPPVIEVNPRDKDEYRILSPTNTHGNE